MYRQHEGGPRRQGVTPRLELDVYRVAAGDTLMLPPHQTGRVELEYYDSNDPYHCACFPNTSSKDIPTMIYDHIRCPHPERHIQPAQDEVFAYPWTVQSYAPPTRSDFSRLPSALSDVSDLTIKSAPAYMGGVPDDKVSLKTLPNTAPIKTTQAGPRRWNRSRPPRLEPIYQQDRYSRLDTIREDQEVHPTLQTYRTSNRHKKLTSSRYPNKGTFLPQTSGSNYPLVPSRGLRPASEDYPSLPPTGRGARPPLKMQGRDTLLQHWDFDKRQYKRKFPEVDSPRRAAATPHPLPPPPRVYTSRDPGRMFQGEYVDPRSGRRYRYNVRYGNQHVQGTKHSLLTA